MGEGFLLVYSITSRSSFEEIDSHRTQILRVNNKDTLPMIIVGNNSEREDERQVSSEGEKQAHVEHRWL